jgi:hypothetical protein
MTPTQRAHALRRAADVLHRIEVHMLNPISANPHAPDAMKDMADDLSWKVWRIGNVLDDAAERLSPWPCWGIAQLDAGKRVPAVKS